MLVQEASERFESEFNIRFLVAGYVTWDSDDSHGMSEQLPEAVNETGFYRGMLYNGYSLELLIVLTDQDVGDGILGLSWRFYWAMIARETLIGLPPRVQCTDNIIQHELSHFYDTSDHDVRQQDLRYDCVMNYRSNDFIFPEGYVPHGLVTENWCSECRQAINQNRNRLGYHQWIGDGSPGEYPVPCGGKSDEL